jgi:hypothetical protein
VGAGCDWGIFRVLRGSQAAMHCYKHLRRGLVQPAGLLGGNRQLQGHHQRRWADAFKPGVFASIVAINGCLVHGSNSHTTKGHQQRHMYVAFRIMLCSAKLSK